MLQLQAKLLVAWLAAGHAMRARIRDARGDERGEVTATTALIVLLVVAAITGGIIAAKITGNANNVPSP